MGVRFGSNRPRIISETISLDAGGSFVSSAFLVDQISGLTGYTQSKSSAATIIVNQSVNSGFTSAVSNSIVINSLGYSTPYSFSTMPGRYLQYTINAVNSATQLEFNMMGTTT